MVGGGKREARSRTFTTRVRAVSWGEQQVQLIDGEGVGRLAGESVLLRDIIRAYLNDPHVTMARSKRYSLEMISDCDIAQISVGALLPKHVVDFCKDRRAAGAGPSTVSGDVSHLRAVLKTATALQGVETDDSAVAKAIPTLIALQLIGKPQIRTRRAEGDELERLREGLRDRSESVNALIPFVDILDFSLLSCMRIGEVCKIMWDDLNEAGRWILVRDRKDPRKKAGNHMRVPLLGEALDIILRQPRTDDPRIFPFSDRSVTAGFQRVRNRLGIKDFRYHDLRREGASRLFEQGYTIDQVAQVTGHRNLNTLWRIYTQLSPERLRGQGPER